MPRSCSSLAALLLLLAACPQANQADPAAGKVAPPPVADSRVVSDGSDLYAAKGGAQAAAPDAPTPGTGLSDETNGKCRLFAPELDSPECCERQLGFDAPAVQAACGLKIYLGESFHGTCGYHFVADATSTGMLPRYFRLSVVPEATAKAAAETQDRRIQKIKGFVAAAPFPGIPNVWWNSAEDLHWAFIPGWSQIRMLTWSNDSCGAEGMEKVIRGLMTTPEILAGSTRTSVVPGGPAVFQAGPVTPAADASAPATAPAPG